ncbi:hypothetical protein PCC8801_1573 [Rippkaea orientalis PCC 8801]|uniref:Uncharacterized protein n=1 Tax=Rippkaea orientalis (strain PCC 8801 / RF-1) TaxID=41431 RepID=B7JUT1_RIPO1|nr:hypothetical protein [Rippkaea orientalis]ACK65625.1 hypothetical protein PCC8801_1573 [Rippkaea orientalis PCC 8801]
MSQLTYPNPSEDPTNNNHNALIPNQPDHQELIEGEIIDQGSSETPDPVVSLVHHSASSQTDNDLILRSLSLSQESYEENSEGTLYAIATPVKLWLEHLSTPWGMGSLALLVFANMILTGVQLFNAQRATTGENPLETISQLTSAKNLSISEGLNVAKLSSESLPFDALSTLSLSFQGIQPSGSKVSQQLPVTGKVSSAQSSSNLTQALLPPSLQPQPMTSYGLSSSAVPVASPQNVTVVPPLPVSVPRTMAPMNIQPPPPPPMPSNNQLISPLTVPTLSQSNNPQAPKIEIYPPSNNPQGMLPQIEIYPPANNPQAPKIEIYAPTNHPEVSPEEKNREVLLQQIKKEETEASPSPLGFNNKTRLEMQNRLNKVEPTQLPRQMKQLEHLQQRRILDSTQ